MTRQEATEAIQVALRPEPNTEEFSKRLAAALHHLGLLSYAEPREMPTTRAEEDAETERLASGRSERKRNNDEGVSSRDRGR